MSVLCYDTVSYMFHSTAITTFSEIIYLTSLIEGTLLSD